MSKHFKKEKLFEKYSKNLESVKPYLTGKELMTGGPQIICPLCRYTFTKNAFDKKYDDHLTIEHAPPKAMGGHEVALTCKICNNNAGGRIESAYIKYHAVEALKRMEELVPIDAVALINGILSRRGYLSFDKAKREYQFHSPSDEYTIPKVEKLVRGNDNKMNLLVKFSRPAERVANLTLLKTAYLLAFEKLGYAYILHEQFDLIREQIRCPEKEIIKNTFVLNLNEDVNSNLGLFKVIQPIALESLMVRFKTIMHGRTDVHTVILPSVHDSNLTIYDKLERLEKTEEYELMTVTVPDANYITDPKTVMIPYLVWNELNFNPNKL